MTLSQHAPLVSIIIPCWNAESYVGAAIESALSQTYPTVEVIVIDDGSTDGSMEVIRSFGKHIRCETGPNRGASAARNRGLDLSRGKLIQFLDADDVLFSNKLERMVPLAVANGSDVLPICDWEITQENEGLQRSCSSIQYAQEDPFVFALRQRIQTSSPLHWKANLKAVSGFDTCLPCSQERDLHLRLFAGGLRLTHIPLPLYRVLNRSASISADSASVLDQHLYIYSKVFDLLKQTGRLTPTRQKAIAVALATDARYYVRAGYLDKADTYFKAAAAIDSSQGLNCFGWRFTRLLARVLGPIQTELLIQKTLHPMRVRLFPGWNPTLRSRRPW
jgi:glycosyltransferase involved in cell wall biosynthesis